MNSKLYGNKVELPEEVVSYLGKCFDAAKGADESTEGYKRNQELRNSKNVTYQQLKRMKNFFDNFTGKESDLPFILNGAHYVKNWVNNTLGSMRSGTSISNQVRNQHVPNQKELSVDNLKINNLNQKSHHKHNLDYDLAVVESLRRINDLNTKII